MTVDELEKEYYLSGNPLPEYLVNMAEIGENCPRDVGDIRAGFPEEGFLDRIMSELSSLIQDTHKNNKLIPTLIRLREALEEVAETTWKNVEYGNEEIEKLEKQLGIESIG